MILVVSNRMVNEGAQGGSLFHSWVQEQELETIHFAEAQRGQDASELSETPSPWEANLLSHVGTKLSDKDEKQKWVSIFKEWRKNGKKRHWVLAIHGYSQSFEENLNASQDLSDLHDVEVINFSWPADPPGSVFSHQERYESARLAAKQSAPALLNFLTTLSQALQASAQDDAGNSPISCTLLVHSLGNFLLESLVRHPQFQGQTHFFDTVILHQADVDEHTHMEWIEKLQPSRIYITVNKFDKTLRVSDVINSDRLGNLLNNLTAKSPFYLDFTKGGKVAMEHNFFIGDHDNEMIKHVCKEVLQGRRGEQAAGYFEYDEAHNVWRFK